METSAKVYDPDTTLSTITPQQCGPYRRRVTRHQRHGNVDPVPIPWTLMPAIATAAAARAAQSLTSTPTDATSSPSSIPTTANPGLASTPPAPPQALTVHPPVQPQASPVYLSMPKQVLPVPPQLALYRAVAPQVILPWVAGSAEAATPLVQPWMLPAPYLQVPQITAIPLQAPPMPQLLVNLVAPVVAAFLQALVYRATYTPTTSAISTTTSH